jgi:predicted aminopeptidase
VSKAAPSFVVALALAFLASGCGTLSYLAQAGYGQREITLGARPLDEAAADASLPPATRGLISEIPRIKAFGERNGLSPTKSYAKFVDLHRRYVVWVVTACAPLAFHPKVWSFPVVGGVTYLGWFHARDAYAHADRLRAAGWDVDVRGSTAYSTLGWFEDPVLSTMLGSGPGAIGGLAETVLHESLHATLYVKNQSPFDEAVATWVGDRLAEAYLVESRGEASPEVAALRGGIADGLLRAAILHEGYETLAALYTSTKTNGEKLREKDALIADVERRVGAQRPITNATLVQFRTYHTGVSALDALHETCGRSFPRTIAALRRGAASAFTKPQDEDVARVFRRIAAAGCD